MYNCAFKIWLTGVFDCDAIAPRRGELCSPDERSDIRGPVSTRQDPGVAALARATAQPKTKTAGLSPPFRFLVEQLRSLQQLQHALLRLVGERQRRDRD